MSKLSFRGALRRRSHLVSHSPQPEEYEMSSGLRQFLIGAMAVALASPAFAQNTGTITGRITERQTQRPLGNVQVRVVGTNRGAVTSDSGTYRVVNVPAGTAQLAVQRLGYGPQTRSLSVTGGGTSPPD